MNKILGKWFSVASVVTAVVLTTTACSSDDTAEQPITEQSNAIMLDVQEVSSPVSRAQHTGSMDFTQLKATGFGVYGYEGTYNSSTSEPTLFTGGANTHVTFISGGTDPTTLLTHPGSWDYTNNTTANLKKWGNVGETTTKQKYTFFAYAPWMSSGEGTAGTDAGINTISTGNGDPTITYTVATNPAQSVDLLWGVRTAYTSDGTTKAAGLPWIDVTQGDTHSAVLFTFYHALCAIGLHAQVMVDQENDTDNLGDVSQLGTIGDKNGCKITLKSITITPAGSADTNDDITDAVNFHQSATLNLNNTTAHQPLWSGHTGTIASLVLNSNATIDEKLLDPNTSDFSTPNPTNYDVMNNASYDDEVPGITETANTQTIIKDDKLFMLIPQVAQNYRFTIEYYMTYKTESGYHREAFTGHTTIKNLKLEAGVKYYLNLVFGLTTFKLTVDAVDWEESTTPVTIATETGTSAGHSLAKRQ